MRGSEEGSYLRRLDFVLLNSRLKSNKEEEKYLVVRHGLKDVAQALVGRVLRPPHLVYVSRFRIQSSGFIRFRVEGRV